MKGGEKMAAMVNMIPVEAKPKVAPQGATTKDNAKSDQPTIGFAKVLNNQTDKTGKDDTNTKDNPNAKDNTATQLMAAMMGMAVPAIATTMTSNSNQSSNELANDTKGALSELVGNGLATDRSTSSQSQLAALLAKMTDTNASLDSNKIGGLAQAQLQELLQGKQLLGLVQTTDVSAEKVDLTADKALLGTIASFTSADNGNGVGKNNSTPQVESKKTTQARVTTGTTTTTTTTADLVELVGTTDVKNVTAPQSVVNVVDAITSDSKENALLLGDKAKLSAENVLVDGTVKDTNAFATLLNQQVVKNENQVVVSDTKQIPQQPVKDPYNIASQIVEQARVVTGQKNTEMIVQLKPEHLGELTFKVTVESGVVSASFHSNNSEVRSVIEASLPQLKQELTNQGLKIENVGVYAGLGEFFSNGQQRESQQKPEVKVHNKKIEEDFIEALESTSAMESNSDGSGVDYRV